jgi:transglutaminase superfamily protein
MTRYALAHHVFVCFEDEHVVFLDVRRGRYFTLRAEQTRSLANLVRGWPVEAANAQLVSSMDVAADSAALAPLVERGLLTHADQAGKDATPIQFAAPSDELAAEMYEGEPHVDALALLRFVKAAFAASFALRYGRFDGVIDRARERRRARDAHLGITQEAPLERARTHQLIATFAWLRPIFYTSKDQCLFEALALGKFLASYRIHPRWVFGVQARPFAAHCWLQQDGVVFNDTVEYVSRYTPIMVV